MKKKKFVCMGEKYGTLTVESPPFYINGGRRQYTRCSCQCGDSIIIMCSILKMYQYKACERCKIIEQQQLHPDGRKICSACKQNEKLDQFKTNNYTYDGYHTYCIECQYFVHIKRKYNLTKKDYLNLLKISKNLCAICKKSPNGERLYIDHCHINGNIRGLLCRYCNALLGFANDNINTLKESIKYLEQNS